MEAKRKMPPQVGKPVSGESKNNCTSIIQPKSEKVKDLSVEERINDLPVEEKIRLINTVKSVCKPIKDSLIISVCDIALECLELQTPKFAIQTGTKKINDLIFAIYTCPTCNKDFIGGLQNYCNVCGQALKYGVKK